MKYHISMQLYDTNKKHASYMILLKLTNNVETNNCQEGIAVKGTEIPNKTPSLPSPLVESRDVPSTRPSRPTALDPPSSPSSHIDLYCKYLPHEIANIICSY